MTPRKALRGMLCLLLLAPPRLDAQTDTKLRILVDAIEGRREREVASLIERGVDVNGVTEEDTTPIEYALRGSSTLAILGLLLDAGARLPAAPSDDQGQRWLMTALRWSKGKTRDDRAFELLLDHGIVPRHYPDATRLRQLLEAEAFETLEVLVRRPLRRKPANAICFAIGQGDDALFEDLLAREWSLGNCDGGSPVVIAARQGRLDMLRTVIDHGAKPSRALYTASRAGHLDIVRWLAGSGIAFGRDERGSALEQAAAQRHTEIVRLLLDQGGRQALTPHQLNVALGAALRTKDPGLVRLLLDAGGDARASVEGKSMLSIAQWTNVPEIVEMVLERRQQAGPEPTTTVDAPAVEKPAVEKPAVEKPALTGFVRSCDPALVEQYVAQVGDPRDAPSIATCVHHAAVRCDDLRVLDLLLGHGASIDLRDENGHTPLHRLVGEPERRREKPLRIDRMRA